MLARALAPPYHRSSFDKPPDMVEWHLEARVDLSRSC